MRSSLSCQWCRRAKVKCRHNGSPPCRACASNSSRNCTLSLPRKKSAQRLYSNQELPSPTRPLETEPSTSTTAQREDTRPDILPVPASAPNDQTFANLPCVASMVGVSASSVSPKNTKNFLATVGRETICHAIEIFQQRFTMFSFLHGPTVNSIIYKDHPLGLQFCGILAVCARFIPKLVHQHGSPLLASEYFAAYLRRTINCDMATGHDITIAQTLLLLSFHDWAAAKGGCLLYTSDAADEMD